ncbi:MAG TPA: Hsp33 family molecular chaperone HslO [Gammaproteobacteria bacterium]|nr:Hsp33 family molecular chaperone HslO [Gammaproteobacteria bacterium]
MQQDTLVRFILENRPIRGEIVYLDESYREVMNRHPYPLEIQKLLGELLAGASLLSATLKYEGALIIQIQGNGPISLLLAQANSERQLRGLAKWEGEIPADFNQAVGEGKMAITIDPGIGVERYQGIVELRGNNIARIIENYFYQSEQLPTFLFLCANESRAVGFLVQSLPQEKNEILEDWLHVEHLVRTLTEKELLELPPEKILYRLFNQETVKIFEGQPVSFYCRCSRDAMAKAIFTMGKEEARQLAEEHQVVSVTCEFCNKKQDFDRIDIERIFFV